MTTDSEANKPLTTITNPDHTEFGSDLLDEMAALGTSAYHSTADKKMVQVPGKKGELVTALVIHLAGAIIFELLRLAAKRLMNHPLYDPLVSLNINGQRVILRDAVNEQ